MLTGQIGATPINIVETPIAHAGQFVGWQGWVKNRPYLFITYAGGRPLTDYTAAVSRDQIIEFITPGALASLFAGDAPMDPRVCANRCIEVANALHVEPDEFRLSQIIDLVQACADPLHKTPTYDLIVKGGARGKRVIGEMAIKANGQLLHEAEVRV